MAYTVFVDGAEGTTGLRIRQRLQQRADIQLLTLPEEARKELPARLEAVAQADVSILCLPDDAAKELVRRAPGHARIIDTSTAHRTAPGWVYGFPELDARRKKIASAARVAVPGCHASGFLALAAPLLKAGAISAGTVLTCHSLTGYSGGGKKMIAAYEAENLAASYAAPRLYGLAMAHKHLPEMQAMAGLTAPPLFCPVVADYYAGMLVSIPLAAGALAPGRRSRADLAALYADYYRDEPLITVHDAGKAPPDGTLAANQLAGRDCMELFVLGSEEQLLLCARFDNLGKGASGAAVQCLNLLLGTCETEGLVL